MTRYKTQQARQRAKHWKRKNLSAVEKLTRRCELCDGWFLYADFPTDYTRTCIGCSDPASRPVEDDDAAWILNRFNVRPTE